MQSVSGFSDRLKTAYHSSVYEVVPVVELAQFEQDFLHLTTTAKAMPSNSNTGFTSVTPTAASPSAAKCPAVCATSGWTKPPA
jgi:hypothetical protein